MGRYFLTSLLAALLIPAISSAASISIIIDDIGYNRENSFKAVNLGSNITLALLPNAPYVHEVAAKGEEMGLELILHVPMESMSQEAPKEPEYLSIEQTEHEFKSMLRNMLERFPQIRGVNNHQGSLLTRHPGHMNWLMDELLERGGLYFVDSRTHSKTVAARISREHGLETAERAFFLDSAGNNYSASRTQAKKILKSARENPFLVVIAHPFSNSLVVLKQLIKELQNQGHQIVPTSHLILMMENQLYLARCDDSFNQNVSGCLSSGSDGG